jgi:hypothetical protein
MGKRVALIRTAYQLIFGLITLRRVIYYSIVDKSVRYISLMAD